jgi:hypothetical protein
LPLVETARGEPNRLHRGEAAGPSAAVSAQRHRQLIAAGAEGVAERLARDAAPPVGSGA